MSAPETADKPTPGPWEYVASTEHHGAYVTSEFSSDICDCYAMSDSKPVPFIDMDANARLISAAPEMLGMLRRILRHGELGCVSLPGSYTPGKKPPSMDVWQFPRHMLTDLDAVITKATGAP